MVAIPFCGQAYTERTLNANAQAAINLYPVRSPQAQGEKIVMYPTPGYSLLYDVVAASGIAGVGAIRGTLVINQTLYVISGTKFLRITGSGPYTATELGALVTSSGRCSIVCNTVEIAISDGSKGYVYNLNTASFTQISGGSWPAGGVTNLAFMDGYVLGANKGSSRVIQSDLLASGTYGAQAYVDVSSYPDNNVAVFSDQLQLLIFGPRLTELRYNSADTPFAFAKTSGALIQAGCVSWATIVKVGGSIIWLASDAAGKAYVAALDSYTAKPLSTPAMNEAIQRYRTITDAFGYTYMEGGTQFYVITFPSENATWAMDVGTGWWHQRSVNDGRDLPDNCVLWNDLQVVGDATGRLWVMSQDYNTDHNGNGLKRVRTCAHVGAENLGLFIDEVNIDIEAGTAPLQVNANSPLDTEAQAVLEVSKDRGHTWIIVGAKGFGTQGDYRKRLTWRKLGFFRNGVVLRLTVTDTVRTFILGAYAKIRAASK